MTRKSSHKNMICCSIICDDIELQHQKLATKDEQPSMVREGVNWEEFFPAAC